MSVLLFSLLSCQVEVSSPSVKKELTRPDIILVIVDTLRSDHLGCYGYSRNTTPNIDAVAAEGLQFMRAYAQASWTLPSFVSLWTGLYPHEHLVGRSPDVHDVFGALPPERITLAELLQTQGYATGAVINNTFLAPEFGVHQGFGDYMYRGADNTDFRSAAATNTRALTWLKEVKDKPAFLVVHYMEPHMDLIPALGVRGRYADTDKPLVPVPFRSPHAYELTQDQSKRTPEVVDYVRALYDEEILDTDAAFGQLLRALQQRERWDNTVLIVTADHGEEFWDHGEFEHGHTLRSVVTQVPLIVTGPGFKGMGKKDILVEHVDLFQGILALGGAPSPEESHGVNIFELAKIDDPPERWSLSENTLYGEPMLSVVTPKYRLLLNQFNGVAALWNMEASGAEGSVVAEEDRKAVADPILGSIKHLRGHFKPIEQVAGPQVPSQDTFQQLKSLGYIE